MSFIRRERNTTRRKGGWPGTRRGLNLSLMVTIIIFPPVLRVHYTLWGPHLAHKCTHESRLNRGWSGSFIFSLFAFARRVCTVLQNEKCINIHVCCCTLSRTVRYWLLKWTVTMLIFWISIHFLSWIRLFLVATIYSGRWKRINPCQRPEK